MCASLPEALLMGHSWRQIISTALSKL